MCNTKEHQSCDDVNKAIIFKKGEAKKKGKSKKKKSTEAGKTEAQKRNKGRATIETESVYCK